MKFKFIGLMFLLVNMSSQVLADESMSDQNTKQEISHLLNYVKQTNCQYERNGNFHNGEEAFEHIQNKYEYFEEDIESTEDFIRLSATRSTMSGKAYQIHCPDQSPIPSATWLKQELARFRAQ